VWIVVIGLALGVMLGLALPNVLPASFAHYLSIALLAALDSAFGGLRASLENKFVPMTFVTGLISNAVLAGLLTFLGDKMGVQLYYAALFAFGFRIFQNLGNIRHLLIDRWMKSRGKLRQSRG